MDLFSIYVLCVGFDFDCRRHTLYVNPAKQTFTTLTIYYVYVYVYNLLYIGALRTTNNAMCNYARFLRIGVCKAYREISFSLVSSKVQIFPDFEKFLYQINRIRGS